MIFPHFILIWLYASFAFLIFLFSEFITKQFCNASFIGEGY